MSRVFAVADRGHDLSAALQFGRLTFLVPFIPNVFATDQMAERIRSGLATSAPDDYLIPVGSLPLTCLAAAALALRHGHVNLLLIDKHTGTYVPRRVTAAQLCPPPEEP